MKQAEIGMIPDDWEVKEIGETGKLKAGYTYNFKKIVSGKYPCFGGNGIREYIDTYIYDGVFPIIGRQGELCGNVTLAKGKFYATEHAVVMKPFKQFDAIFLYYKLIESNLNQYATGCAQPGLSVGTINKTPIILPTNISEQQKIAKALSDVDNVISTLEKLITKKKNLKQGTMQQLLTGKKRLPGFAPAVVEPVETPAFKQTEIGEIPEDWEVVKIKSFAKVFDGTHQTPNYVDVGIPFYSVENVTADDFEHTKYITQQEHKLLSLRVKIEKGDILMTRIGSIGDCRYVDWEPNASFYVSLALIKCNNKVDPRYISYYSNSEQFHKELELRSLFYAIPQKINLGPISEITICMPEKKEQTAIANFISDMDKEIKELCLKLEKYQNLKIGMMQQLLTGKIRLI